MDKVLQWNIRGFNCNYNELRRIIGNEDPSVISLQETLLKPNQNVSLSSYQIFRKDVDPNWGSRAHGGVAILVKNHIPTLFWTLPPRFKRSPLERKPLSQ